MFRYTQLFTTQIDPTSEKRSHVEQRIAERLFRHFALYTLFDHAFSVVAPVVEVFPPINMQAVITSALMEKVKGALLTWQQALHNSAQPSEEETQQIGKKLLLLILWEIHPGYVENATEHEGQEQKQEVTDLDLILHYLKAQLTPTYSTGEEKIYATVLAGTQLLKTLRESSEYPHPYVELPSVPSLLFPLRNTETGEWIWIEISPSHYGFSVTAHRRKPRIRDVASNSRETAMGGIHVDYYVASQVEPLLTQKGTPRKRWEPPQEVLQVQLYDETVGPYDEPHWQLPDAYSVASQEASIVLVRDVRKWRSTETEADA